MALSSTLEAASARLSRARGRRWLHPFGDGYRGALSVHGGAGTGLDLLDVAATHTAIIRMSRATGVPRPLPDAYGLAFRLPDLGQDVLVTTSVDAPVLHHLPLPAPRGPWSQSYSSVLGFRVGRSVRLLGAIPVERERAFDLVLARIGGRWERPVARLRLGEPLGTAETEALDLDVWHHGAGLVPVGPFQGLRRPVYAGSRRGRGRA